MLGMIDAFKKTAVWHVRFKCGCAGRVGEYGILERIPCHYHARYVGGWTPTLPLKGDAKEGTLEVL